MGWTLWLTFLTGVSPWGTYVLVLLGLSTLLSPAQILLYRAKYSGDMARLTPAHERPERALRSGLRVNLEDVSVFDLMIGFPDHASRTTVHAPDEPGFQIRVHPSSHRLGGDA